ncbi:MAG: hypothetical protein JW861_02515 [Bacteroidales bacterium]|nr:hypothetical protein [Bacteroidales bacterium]
MKKVLFCMLALTAYLIPGMSPAQEFQTYKHPEKFFFLQAEKGWNTVSHDEDRMIFELVDPSGTLHVMLWYTETELEAMAYLEKMAGTKGLQWEMHPEKIQIGGRDAWMIDGTGEVGGEPSAVLLATIPVADDTEVTEENHTAHYVVQVWCPSGEANGNRERMETLLKSAVVRTTRTP